MNFRTTNKLLSNKIWTHSIKQWVKVKSKTEYPNIVKTLIRFDNMHITRRCQECFSWS